jgi:hypothetical protein
MDSEPQEQLRRLKNTIMGAGHRLNQLAKSGAFPDQSSPALRTISGELAEIAQRLERLLAALRQNR